MYLVGNPVDMFSCIMAHNGFIVLMKNEGWILISWLLQICIYRLNKSVEILNSISYAHGRTRLNTITHQLDCNRKMHLTIDEYRSKIARNSVFDCHLSPVGRQMAIENSVSNDFWSTCIDSIDVFDCRLPGVNNSRTMFQWKKICQPLDQKI